MSELPDGWEWSKLEAVAEILMGQSPPGDSYNQEGIGTPLINGPVEFGPLPFSKTIKSKFTTLPTKICKENDLILCVRGSTTGRMNIAGFEACIGRGVAAIRSQIYQKYLNFFIHSYQEQIYRLGTGSTFPNVSFDMLSTIDMPVPPLNEQRRIVAKLEKLLAKCEACKQRLDKIPGILKRFRQSILAAACSGRLTADWREQNLDVEPASELLNRIREDRGQRLQESGRKNILIEDFIIQEPEDGLPEIPEKWIWVALGSYAECSRGRFSVRPRNDPRYYGGQYPFIQIGDLPREGGLISNHQQTLNEDGLSISKMFPTGTVAIAIVGATIGNTGILAYDMCFPDSLVGIQTGSEVGNIYLDYYLRSEKKNLRTISYAGGGQPNIKLETLNPYPFPLPPFEEQKEIVQRVEKLFKLVDQIEQRYQKSKTYVNKLPQSILAKAFRGELVPQDPNDESASILLERIRAEREQQISKGSRGGKGSRGNVRKKGNHKEEFSQLNLGDVG